MKWIIVVTLVLSLYSTIDAKRDEKSQGPIKKAKGAKPTKTPKTSILEQFRNLSPEDKEFLKELDKQFSLHGDKIKIKVERENFTKGAKGSNKKRTIDGELGYTYNQDQYEHGYYFSNPGQSHYNRQGMRYTNPHREVATDIEIQPSHSYEVKPMEETYQHSPRTQYIKQMHGYTEDNVPIIVLKIPGPTKYAAHLQALLQQYLELRAAQYIRAFEEQEAAHYQTGYDYGYAPTAPVAPIAPVAHKQAPYPAQPIQPVYYQPMVQVAPNLYTPVPNHHQSQSHQYYSAHQSYTPSSYYYNHPSAAPYHMHPTHAHVAEPQVEYSPKYVESTVAPPVAAAVKEYYTPDITYANYDDSYQPQPAHEHQYNTHEEQSEDHYEDSSAAPLKTSENYPSDKHTQVIFKEDKVPYNAHYGHYIRKEDQIQVTPAPAIVEITQRPHNYHAHPEPADDSEHHDHHYETAKRQTAPFSEEMFRKYNKLIQRMKKQTAKVQQQKAKEEQQKQEHEEEKADE